MLLKQICDNLTRQIQQACDARRINQQRTKDKLPGQLFLKHELRGLPVQHRPTPELFNLARILSQSDRAQHNHRDH